MSKASEPLTVLIEAARGGDSAAAGRLFTAVYDELKTLARANRRRWQGDHTMNTTAVINELYIKLAERDSLDYANRTHFFATASKAMRHILVSYARDRGRQKRGGDALRVTFDDTLFEAEISATELIDLEAVLEKLESSNPRLCRVVECRVFAGMDVEETAAALGISTATAKRDWRVATARIYQALSP